MIYKRHEISQSLNGDEIVYIARNTLGNVIFRAPSEKDLKSAIDEAEAVALQLAAEEEKRKEEAEKKKAAKKKKGLFQAEEPEEEPKEEPEEETSAGEESILVPTSAPQARVTRGPDGKFISKSALEVEEQKKQSLWEKLTS